MCGQLVVDRATRFGAEVTIADLARHSFPDFNCNLVHIYEVWARQRGLAFRARS
jgi:hypothetical protein